ncbi:MAG TPA: outer membrane beta-barrel family protein [Chitinophagaceae bacterium]|nr:outer membrane beta-barrel family protein [Chitinophagaceae bacterium]
MHKVISLVVPFILITNFLKAQTHNGDLSGKVVDGGNQKVIDAASVSLYKAKDSSLVKISLADKKGNFLFENIPAGDYFLIATSTGHTQTNSAAIHVNGNSNTNAGILKLEEKTKTLADVTVTVAPKKAFIERKIDKTVINVDASITSAGSTALEVLEKAPGVTVDKDGNVSLKGKAGVMIMMDGKPSYLSGDQLANLLKSMPSSEIDQIEIMTNPSAKYDAAGNSGIINIKTRKNKLKGLNGNVAATVTQGRYTKTNEGFNINYRKGKVNLFANYNYSYWKGFEKLYIHRNFKDTITQKLETIFDQNSFMHHLSWYQNLKAGIDFNVSKNTSLGVVLTGFLNPSSDPGTNTTLLEDATGKVDSILYAENADKSRSDNFGANFNFRHAFDSTGKEFTVDLDYLTYYQKHNQFFRDNHLNPDYTVNRPPDELKGTLPSAINIYSAKTDFTFPMKHNAKFETGWKSSYVTTDNDALYQDSTSSGYVTDDGKTNHFVYKENINAAYINFSKQINKWGMQVGLRAENTNAKGHQLGNSTTPDSSFTKNYIDLFPTAFVSYDANKKNTFSINFGRRIDRPDYQDLNPFYYFLDEYTYQVGNTLLQPQYTDNAELSHTYNNFLTTTLNYSRTKNVFTDVLKQVTSERKTFQTKENIASKTNFGLSVSAYFPVTKWFTTNIYTNVFHDTYKGALDGGYLSVDTYTFLGNISNQFKLKKGWSAEVSGFYRSKGLESEIVIDPLWRVDAGIQKKVLRDKGTIKLGIRDIFASQNFNGYVNYQDIDVIVRSRHDSRTGSLTFTYNFGKPMQNQRRHSGGASDEESRVKAGGN